MSVLDDAAAELRSTGTAIQQIQAEVASGTRAVVLAQLALVGLVFFILVALIGHRRRS